MAALLAGCSVAGGEGETRTVTVREPSEPAARTGEVQAPAPAPEGPAVAEGEGSVGDGRVRFVITELERSGPTVVLNARVERIAGDSSLQVTDTFSDGQYQKLASGENEEGQVFDGVALIDPEGRKKYLVARDAEGRCVCSNGLSGAFIKEAPLNLEATLSAPPPAVKRVDVVVPRVKTFTDVPLAE